MDENEFIGGRAKRQKIDKSGRSAALERLKSLKGGKNKCQIGDVDNVYEYIDEKEYSKRVLQRQDEDWIENPGDGYIEDGREIFDDEFDDEEMLEANKRSFKTNKAETQKPRSKSKSILQMVANMPVKKKKTGSDCDILSLLDESLNSDSEPSNQKSETLSSKEYIKMLSSKASLKIDPRENDTKSSIELIKKPEVVKDVSVNLSNNSLEQESNHKMFALNNSYNFESNFPNDIQAGNKTEAFTDVLNIVDFEHDDIEMERNTIGDEEKKKIIDNNKQEYKTNLKTQSLNISASENSVTVKLKDHYSDVGKELLNNAWESVSKNENISVQNVSIDKSDLPLTNNSNGEKVFRFFWWDAYEDSVKQPGVVYLLGKVYYEKKKVYVSCCVAVENIQRRVFLLPREKKFDAKTKTLTETPVTLLDVYQEFNDKIATPNKIMNFKSRKITLKYAFDLADVPLESEYLEVKYPSTYCKLAQDLSGETFSRVFGVNTNSLELLLLERKIKGPCWLEVKNPQDVNVPSSWCKLETRCSKMEDLFVSDVVAPPPPMVIMAINIRTVVNTNMDNEIIMIGVVIHNQYKIDKTAPIPPFTSHFCTITRSHSLFWPSNADEYLSKCKRTEVIVHQAEKSLLNHFLTKVFTIDPDVIIGHELFGFTMDTLIQRIQHHKVPNWSRIGRLKRAVIPQFRGKQVDKTVACGRLVCDVVTSARELIRARSYDLTTLCKQVLGMEKITRQDLTPEEIKEKFEKNWTIQELITATMEDTSHILRITYEMNVLPLSLQITKIAGNVMSKTLLGGRSERNEFLLLHAFTEQNYLVPDKNYSKRPYLSEECEENDGVKSGGKKKPQYAGGLVLEPKKGFYDKFILLMDFNSLYPSIIQEYNICFTTIIRSEDEDEKPECPLANQPLGILPIEIQKLVQTRREVKSLMKTPNLAPELYMQHNIRQTALKLTANSMYGCLGFVYSRFYAKQLAGLVTSKGREILLNTKSIVEKMNFNVIYGDTDSIMINTNCTNYDEVFQIGQKIKEEINRAYKYIELEIDGVFKYMLLLKKKKYAAIVLSKKPGGELVTTKEYKGLDIVRRDWCQLSAEVGRNILNQILSDLNPEDRVTNIKEHLQRIADDLKNHKVPIPLLAITKQLTKNPSDYPDVKSLPHLQVALRMNAKGGKKLRAGNTVSYVICDNGTNVSPLQRAFHVDELKSNSELLVDVKYYLSQQIHPVVSRLCEPIDGIDAAFIAECLGLDPSGYRKTLTNNSNADKTSTTNNAVDNFFFINDLEAFKRCEPFTFVCKKENCGTKNFLEAPPSGQVDGLKKCRNSACTASPVEFLTYIINELTLKIRDNSEGISFYLLPLFLAKTFETKSLDGICQTERKSHIGRFYQNWMVCEDPACTNRTRRVPMRFSNTFPVCTLCQKGIMYREYTSSDLYYQIKFYKYIFSVDKKNQSVSDDLRNAYKILHEKVGDVLKDSAYNSLDLGKLFGKKFKKSKNDKSLQNSLIGLKL